MWFWQVCQKKPQWVQQRPQCEPKGLRLGVAASGRRSRAPARRVWIGALRGTCQQIILFHDAAFNLTRAPADHPESGRNKRHQMGIKPMHHWKRLTVSFAFFLGSSPVWAQSSATAEALFNKGLADMQAGYYETACPAFAELTPGNDATA
jgi:hypothetical protein